MDSPNTHSGGSIHSSDNSHSISPYFSTTPFHNNLDPLPNYFNSHNHLQLQLPPSTSPAPQFPTLPDNNNINQRPPENTRLAVRNPKKRSRASRRAPTTVLTTDTTNFRAMVQEFTGIPAPPFSSSPFNTNTRFDLFPTPNSNPLHSSLLLKPFPFKQQISSFSSSTSLLNAISSTTTTNNNLLSDFTLPKPPSSLGMLNSFIHFEPPTQIDPTQKVSAPNRFGLANGLPSLVSSDAATGDNHPNWVVRQDGGGDNIDNLRAINGTFNFSSSSKGSNVKVNYLGSSSNFQGGNKSTIDHNVSSRSGGEGMLD